MLRYDTFQCIISFVKQSYQKKHTMSIFIIYKKLRAFFVTFVG